jgi:hypothetical protein
MHTRSWIDLQLNAVGVKPPVGHLAKALLPTFGCLHRTIDAFRATDHDALLKAPAGMTVRGE